MSKTFKDKRAIYGGPLKSRVASTEKNLSRRFEKFKQFGAIDTSSYHCHYCGRPTEFEGGYLVCHDCGDVDLAFTDLFSDLAAA